MIYISGFEERVNLVTFQVGEKTGHVSFNYDKENIYILGGLNTEGVEIKEQVVLNEVQGKPNPTKVFKFIVKILKKVLCPECGTNPN